MAGLAGKTMFLSGGSRGIGLAIAKRAAADGANIALIAKTAEPHPRLEGTIFTAAQEIEAVGGTALPIVGDIRHDEQVAAAVAQEVGVPRAEIGQFGVRPPVFPIPLSAFKPAEFDLAESS